MILTHMTDINGIELIKGQSQTKFREQRECDFIFTSSKCPCLCLSSIGKEKVTVKESSKKSYVCQMDRDIPTLA